MPAVLLLPVRPAPLALPPRRLLALTAALAMRLTTLQSALQEPLLARMVSILIDLLVLGRPTKDRGESAAQHRRRRPTNTACGDVSNENRSAGGHQPMLAVTLAVTGVSTALAAASPLADPRTRRPPVDHRLYHANLASWELAHNRTSKPASHRFDLFEPEWACPDDEMVPIDGYGDGHKWMCGLRLAPPAPGACLIYSLGSFGDDRWERAMAQRLPGCEIHIFDPSLLNANATLVSEMRSRARAYGATVHASGIQPMEGTVRALGHVGRRISYLKVDIDDGSEWGLFLGSELRGKDGLWRACAGHSPLLAIDQLTVELHAERMLRVSSLPPPRRNARGSVASRKIARWCTFFCTV